MLIAGLCFCGCPSKEQDEKIHAFWGEQAMKVMGNPAFSQVMMKMAARNAGAMAGFAGKENGFDEQEMQKALEAFQALQAENFDEESFNNFPRVNSVGNKPVAAETSSPEGKTAVLITPSAQKTNVGQNKLAQMLAAVKESNARTMKEYAFLSADQQARIREVMKETEEDLQDLVSKNADMESFVNVQMNLLIAQENRINQIIMEDLSDRAE